MTVRELLLESRQRVPQRDAELLLSVALERTRVWLLAHGNDEVPASAADAFEQFVVRRSAGEPLQYIRGEQEFFGLSLRVGPAVLIPRPETELLVESVLHWARDVPNTRLQVLDVGTGSGAIAIALASHLRSAQIIALDISTSALDLASQNATRLGFADQISFLESDLLTGLKFHDFDAIVSNPPYISTNDAACMQREVVDHEPHAALFGGEDGLDIYRRLIPQAQGALRSHGLLAMELGFGQRLNLERLLAGWKRVRFIDDYAGIPRVVLAERA